MLSMRRDLRIRFALLVRGSSRRITIVRFRPAGIRMINGRDCFLDCLRCRFPNQMQEFKSAPPPTPPLRYAGLRSGSGGSLVTGAG